MKESGGLVADAVGPGLRIVVDTANPVGAADVRTRIAVEPLVDTADIEECTLGRTARGEVELVGNVTVKDAAFSWSESRFTAQAPVHARFAMAVLEMAAKSCRAGVMSERKR